MRQPLDKTIISAATWFKIDQSLTKQAVVTLKCHLVAILTTSLTQLATKTQNAMETHYTNAHHPNYNNNDSVNNFMFQVILAVSTASKYCYKTSTVFNLVNLKPYSILRESLCIPNHSCN